MEEYNQKPIIVLTGGGTGGHIYPNLALVPYLKKRGLVPVYFGGEGSTLEKRLAAAEGLKYFDAPGVKLIRSFSPAALKNNLSIPVVLSAAVKSASEKLSEIKPSAVFSKGGFVSLPVTVAALKLGIPVFCHESDLTQGLANKIAASRGATALKANPNSKFKGEFVGMPLREKIFKPTYASARKELGFSDDEKVVLIVGGSSGAAALNEAVSANLEKLLSKYTVVHITGKGKGADNSSANRVSSNAASNDKTANIISPNGTSPLVTLSPKTRYIALEYADNIEYYLNAADLVVSRAGATAVFEIAALKKHAVFIPLPKGVSRGDQIFNAELAETYGATVIKQDALLNSNLIHAVNETFTKPPMKRIGNDANGKIADLICDSISRGDLCKDKKQ